MKPNHTSALFSTETSRKPLGMVGAGRLASMIWKTGDEQSGWRYRFNVFRTVNNAGRVSQLFAPSDAILLVKLAHVLAAVIADDGCISPDERQSLKRLATELDELWLRLPLPDYDEQQSASLKGATNGNPTGP